MKPRWKRQAVVSLLLVLLLVVPAFGASINGSSWARPTLEKAAEANLVDSALLAKANQTATRAELAQLVVRFYAAQLGGEYTASNKKPFTDTDDLSVAVAYELGLMSGVSGTKFDPNGTVSREQMASVVMRLMKKLGIQLAAPTNATKAFEDESSISSWALYDVKTLKQNGLLSGDESGKFQPKASCTIEQVIVVMMQSSERMTNVSGTATQGLQAGSYTVALGESESSIQSKLGQPNATTTSIYGTPRKLYQKSDGTFLLIGFSNGSVAEIFTNGKTFRYGDITQQTTYGQLNFADYASYSVEKAVKKEGNVTMTLYFDGTTGHPVNAIYLSRSSLQAGDGLYSGSYDADVETELFYLLNGARAKQGLPLLNRNAFSDVVAKNHADEMKKYLRGSYLSADGSNVFERMDGANIQYEEAGENICTTISGDALEIYGWWMSTISTRSNILEDSFTDIGLGVVSVPQRNCFYAVADFFGR